jgi:hypothetical protein
MAKVGSFIHTITHAPLSLNATTAYGTGRRHNMNLQEDYTGNAPPRLNIRLGTLNIRLNTIVTAASVTMRLTRDLAGDDIAFGDTTATISTGVTTAASGNVTFKIDSLYGNTDDNLYCFWKLDAGTATVDQIVVNWEE